MNTTSLTITINNLPNEELALAWKSLAEDFPLIKSSIVQTDNIVIDYEVMKGIDDDSLASVLGGSMACHIALAVYKKLAQ